MLDRLIPYYLLYFIVVRPLLVTSITKKKTDHNFMKPEESRQPYPKPFFELKK